MSNSLIKSPFIALRQFIVRIILKYPALHFIAHIREHMRNYPGGLGRAWQMLLSQGPGAFSRRLKTLLNHGSTEPQLTPNTSIAQEDDAYSWHPKPNESYGAGYQFIAAEFSEHISNQIEGFAYKPLISIIMPVYNVDVCWLEKAIESVEAQWYENWELCLVDDASTRDETLNYLKDLSKKQEQLSEPKIKIEFLAQNGNISKASNAALALAKGDYIALMDNDDEITANALYEVVKVINDTGAEFIYSDEDKISQAGEYCHPHYKSDFSPELILSQNYMSHLGVIKKPLIDRVDGFSIGLEGAQDYDLYLKVLEHTQKIHHISKVLYHWRIIPGSTAAQFGAKSYAHQSGIQALENAVKRRGLKASVHSGQYPGTYRLKYDIENEPLVSVIIPFKDKPELLTLCFESIIQRSSYENFELIGISNNSVDQATFDEMQRLSKLDKRIAFYEYNVPFNYSQINNHGVKEYAKGDYVVLLNNDIEIISESWIEEMLGFAQRDDVGAVGAKLYYPNDTIQHAGVILGIGGVGGHSHKYFQRHAAGYFSRLNLNQNLSAVTAACLMVSKAKFLEIEGLDEERLKVAFNDVDFCLRLREQGYLNVFTPYCEAYHHESISRGTENTPEKQKRFESEVLYMLDRHKQVLANDPYYNKHLSLEHENFSLKPLAQIETEEFENKPLQPSAEAPA